MPSELLFVRMFFPISRRPLLLTVESVFAKRTKPIRQHATFFILFIRKKEEICIFIQNKKLKFAVQLNIYT